MYSVTVLMSTYNGEKYLKEQLDSILQQTQVKVYLEIRDDGSTDKTKEILKEYERTHNNINVHYGENIGFAKSFLGLLYGNYITDYFAFADQDDVWYKDKLVSAVSKLEEINSAGLYFCAQDVVDESLNKVRKQSFEKAMRLTKYSATTIPPCRGCVQVWNADFQKIVVNTPVDSQRVYSHDAWTYLIAFWKAILIYDNNPHIAYRQSANNVMGTYLGPMSRLFYIYRKAMYYIFQMPNSKEKCAKEIERLVSEEEILTAHYRDSLKKRLAMLFDPKYKEGIGFKWRLFNDFLVILGKL